MTQHVRCPDKAALLDIDGVLSLALCIFCAANSSPVALLVWDTLCIECISPVTKQLLSVCWPVSWYFALTQLYSMRCGPV